MNKMSRFPENERGIGLVEVMISLLIFAVAVLGVDRVLLHANAEVAGAEQLVQAQTYGMETSGTNVAAAAGAQTTIQVAVNISAPVISASQACSTGGVTGLVPTAATGIVQSLFGSGTATPSDTVAPTSITVSVPMVAIRNPAHQESGVSWWLP